MTESDKLSPWEILMKRLTWLQIGELSGKKILDFGSGLGITANNYAKDNDVTAIEPDSDSIQNRVRTNDYLMLQGSTEILKTMPDESYDVIFCHNVFEYAADREKILNEFSRLLKPDGFISIVRHNRLGRVMQMAVLLNDFKRANSILDGSDGESLRFGKISCYEDSDIESWCERLRTKEHYGIRTFFDLQQNQEIQSNPDWQEKMISLEMRVSVIEEFYDIAFLHHLIIEKI